MNEVELARDIRTRLEEIFASEDLLVPKDDASEPLRWPQVVNGYLPPKRAGDKEDFPFVIVRPSEGETGTDRMSAVDVKLMIGCFSEEFDGYEYCMLVMNAIRRSFLQHPQVGSVFKCELPFRWQLYDDQPYPEWQLNVTTRWSVATPLEIPDDEGDL